MSTNPSQKLQVSDGKTKKVLRVALILSIATGIEFVIAFVLNTGGVKTSIFILLTAVKAFYIVGEFMHLSHEKKSLIWSIILPTLLIAILLFILFHESAHTLYTF